MVIVTLIHCLKAFAYSTETYKLVKTYSYKPMTNAYTHFRSYLLCILDHTIKLLEKIFLHTSYTT